MPLFPLRITIRAAIAPALFWVISSACLAGSAASSHGAPRESDRHALDQARNACKTGDFRQFFFLFSMSNTVRMKYSATNISYAVLDQRGNKLSMQVHDGARDLSFPIKTMDYDFKPTDPTVAGDQSEYVDLQFNQSQSNVYSVEWARVHYDGQTEGGDDRGNAIDADGKPIPSGTHPDAEGQLLFRPTADCWEFAEDIRWQRGKK